MILIGQYDSSFVRRVGIALTLYGMPFEQRPWSILGDADNIRPYNPLLRVPTLVLDDGGVLVDSHGILNYLDMLAPKDKLLMPQADPERHEVIRIVGLATGVADKGVSLFYEKVLHEAPSQQWIERCRDQIEGALAMLEKARMKSPGDFWFGRMTHADIAVTCALDHVLAGHPGMVDMATYPALEAHRNRMNALPVFRTIFQTFIRPA